MTTLKTTIGPTARPVKAVVGIAPYENPEHMHLVVDGEIVPTEYRHCRAAGGQMLRRARSIELLAWAPNGVRNSLEAVYDPHTELVVTPNSAPAPKIIEKMVGQQVRFGVASTDGMEEAKLADMDLTWEKGPVVWDVTGRGEFANHGAILWRLRAWVGSDIGELEIFWHNANAKKPDPDLRVMSFKLILPDDVIQTPVIMYPGRGADGALMGGTGKVTALLSGRHTTFRTVLHWAGAEGALGQALNVANRDHLAFVEPGGERGFTDRSDRGAPWTAHGDAMSGWGLPEPEAIFAQAEALVDGVREAIEVDAPFPGQQFWINGRLGDLYGIGGGYGAPGGGQDLEVRPWARAAVAPCAEWVEYLEHRAWAEESRGMGLVFWGGRSFELPQRGEDVDQVPWIDYPESLRKSLLKHDSLGSLNYFIDAASTAWFGPGQAHGWPDGDPFGFSALPNRTDQDLDAADRENEMRQYGWRDRQHGILAIRTFSALVSLTNDWLARVTLEALADAYRLDCWEGAGGELGTQWDHVQARPHSGFAPASRQLSWTAWCWAEAVSFLGQEGKRFQRPLRRFMDVMSQGSIPSGWTRDHGWSKIARHVTPLDVEPPLYRGVSQSWYAALLADAWQAAWGAYVSAFGATGIEPPHPTAVDALGWWFVPEKRTWLNYCAVAELPGSPPRNSLAEVPASERSTAPGNVSPAYDSFYHPMGLAAGIAAARYRGDLHAILHAAWVLHTASGGNVSAWIKGRANKPVFDGMDAPIRAICEEAEQLDPAIWGKLAAAHEALLLLNS